MAKRKRTGGVFEYAPGKWGINVRIGGVQIKRRFPHLSHKEVLEVVANLKADYQVRKTVPAYLLPAPVEQQAMTLKELMDHDRQRPEIADSTRALESWHAKVLLDILGEDLPACDLTADMVDRYKATRQKAGLSKRGINAPLQTLRACLNRAVARQQGSPYKLNRLPCEIKKSEDKKQDIRDLSVEQLHRLLTACKSDQRLYDIVTMLALLGLRPCELWRMAWEHVDLERGFVDVWSTKHPKGEPRQRRLPLLEMTREILERYAAKFPDGVDAKALIFGTVPEKRNQKRATQSNENTKPGHVGGVKYLGDYGLRNKLRAAAKRAKIANPETITPYTLRHSFATNFEGNEADLQRAMGHSNPNMTRHYQHARVARLTQSMQRMESQLTARVVDVVQPANGKKAGNIEPTDNAESLVQQGREAI